MAEYLSPGVYVEEFDSSAVPMEGVSTSTAGFIGMAEKGAVVGTPTFVSSFAEYTRQFGGFLAENTHGANRFLPYAVEQFFANGGSRCYVMRVAPEDATLATATRGCIAFSAKNPGKWGNSVKVSAWAVANAKTNVVASEEDSVTGAVTYQFKNASEFSVGDIVALVADGKVTGYNRIALLQGNTVSFEAAIETEIVDAAILPSKTIESVNVNLEIACGEAVESYEGLSLNIASADFIDNRLVKSLLVSVSTTVLEEICPFMQALAGDAGAAKVSFSLAGGADGDCKKADDSLYLGGGIAPGKRTGLVAFEEISNVSIMAIPGVTSPTVQLALVAHCENLASRFAVLDMPADASTPAELLQHRAIVDSNYAAMYHPWVQVFDKSAKKPAYIPPSGAICGVYARSDATRGVHKAPANEVVNNCTGLSCLYNKGEQDVLNPAGVNLIRALPGQGIRVWGARTCTSNALWKYINVRRLFIFLEESIKANTNWAVFEPNDSVLWARVEQTIVSFLRDMFRAGALVGDSEADAFFVRIGHETMSASDIANGKLICEIGVAPSRPAEFVIFRITQTMKD